jgi:hypothetical protein
MQLAFCARRSLTPPILTISNAWLARRKVEALTRLIMPPLKAGALRCGNWTVRCVGNSRRSNRAPAPTYRAIKQAPVPRPLNLRNWSSQTASGGPTSPSKPTSTRATDPQSPINAEAPHDPTLYRAHCALCRRPVCCHAGSVGAMAAYRRLRRAGRNQRRRCRARRAHSREVGLLVMHIDELQVMPTAKGLAVARPRRRNPSAETCTPR